MCVLSLWWGGGVILCLYVDDILIFGMNIDAINEVKSFLLKSFDIKDLGEVYVILNIKLIKGENGITLLQSHYVEKSLSQPVVEKQVPAILMNCDNQTMVVKVNTANDNAKSPGHVKKNLSLSGK